MSSAIAPQGQAKPTSPLTYSGDKGSLKDTGDGLWMWDGHDWVKYQIPSAQFDEPWERDSDNNLVLNAGLQINNGFYADWGSVGGNWGVGNNAVVGGDVDASGSVVAGGRVAAVGDVQAGARVTSTGDVQSGARVTAVTDMSAGGNITATAALQAGTDIVGPSGSIPRGGAYSTFVTTSPISGATSTTDLYTSLGITWTYNASRRYKITTKILFGGSTSTNAGAYVNANLRGGLGSTVSASAARMDNGRVPIGPGANGSHCLLVTIIPPGKYANGVTVWAGLFASVIGLTGGSWNAGGASDAPAHITLEDMGV